MYPVTYSPYLSSKIVHVGEIILAVWFVYIIVISNYGNEYPLEHPIIEYQNRYSVTRKTFFSENNLNFSFISF
jgi:hypothetical protein